MSQDSIVQLYDNSWTVSIAVDELESSYSIRVKDSTLISNLIQDLVDRIHLKYNWTEFALWCDSKKVWLLPRSSTLSPFTLNSESEIRFVRRFRIVSIQLPDLQIRQMMLDFSKSVFYTNQIVCRKMGIRHHEELSFQYRTTESATYKCSSLAQIQKRQSFSSQPDIKPRNWTMRRTINPFTPLPMKRGVSSFLRSLSNNQSIDSPKLRQRSPITPTSTMSFFSMEENVTGNNYNESIYFEGFENSKLAHSPNVTYEQAVRNGDIINYKTYKERSKFRYPWMISELTLMEQGIDNYDRVLLLLRYKYHNYYFLDERYDATRINQIFHQAYWSVLSNEIDCSEDEALILAGILLQVKKSSKTALKTDEKCGTKNDDKDIDDEIDMMLDKLHLELLGKCDDGVTDADIVVSGIVNVIRYPNYFFKFYEKRYAEIKDDGIHLFSKQKLKTTELIPIKGNDIELRVKYSKKEYFILEIINLQNDTESISREDRRVEKYRLKFTDKIEFVRWSAGCRLLSKSIDFSKMADFHYECNVVSNIIDMKRPLQTNEPVTIDEDDEDINLSDLLSFKVNRAFKKRFLLERIVKFQASCSHYNSIQSKIAYIKCWLTLRNTGICYFQVTINRNLDRELIGVAYNRLILGNIITGRLKKIWELSKMITWNTNWELFHVGLEFENETLNVSFLSVNDCQTFHEYVGGYLFILMRNSDKYSDLSEKTFRKLTGRNCAQS